MPGAVVMTRREAVGAVLALPAVSLAAPTANDLGPLFQPMPVAHCLIDGRFALACRVGDQFRRLGGQVLDVPRDAFQCWDQLSASEGAGGAFAGVTTERSLFMLQTLAAVRRMRLVLRVHAERDANGQVHHCVLAPQATWGPCAALLQGADLPAGMARLLRHWRPGPLSASPPMRLSSGVVVGGAGLVSWIIAPAAAQPSGEDTWT